LFSQRRCSTVESTAAADTAIATTLAIRRPLDAKGFFLLFFGLKQVRLIVFVQQFQSIQFRMHGCASLL